MRLPVFSISFQYGNVILVKKLPTLSLLCGFTFKSGGEKIN